MKIKVDYDLCESNAKCEALAPGHFMVVDDDTLQILDERVTDEDQALMEQAVAACPGRRSASSRSEPTETPRRRVCLAG